MSNHFTNDEEFELMLRKDVYPYDYINVYDKLSVEKLPNKSDFYSKLYDENICKNNDEHAKTV